MKRLFDIFTSILGVIIISPLFFTISILIKLKMGSPIFFIQERVGLNGNLFKMIKFRTMYLNKSENSVTFAGDSRITQLGKVLRKYKLDELPELINVLIGEMSIVGPRPDVSKYVDLLKSKERIILKLKPGITSPASLKYKNEEVLLSTKNNPLKYYDEVIFPDKIKMNLEYYFNNNIWFDIKIIFKTLFH